MISHLNKRNMPVNVDVSSKKNTKRSASAKGIVKFSKKTFKLIESLKTKKGNIESIAILAGIVGAKKTSDLIPLCHNILIENVEIKIRTLKNTSSLEITSLVKTNGKTGVEMEALTAVAVSCLTIYDMCKSIDKKIKISEISLLQKSGGKSDFSIK